MNEINYRVFMVPNGSLSDFNRGIIGREIETLGFCADINEAKDRVRELAELESLKDFCSAVDPCVVMADIEKAIETECDGVGGVQSRLIKALDSVCNGFDVSDVVLSIGTPDTDEEREELANAVYNACWEQSRARFVAECVERMGFEWDGDLKWIRVAKFSGENFVEIV